MSVSDEFTLDFDRSDRIGLEEAVFCAGAPEPSGVPSFFTAGSKLLTLPPPICKFVYSSTTLPSTMWRTRSDPSTSASTRTH